MRLCTQMTMVVKDISDISDYFEGDGPYKTMSDCYFSGANGSHLGRHRRTRVCRGWARGPTL